MAFVVNVYVDNVVHLHLTEAVYFLTELKNYYRENYGLFKYLFGK